MEGLESGCEGVEKKGIWESRELANIEGKYIFGVVYELGCWGGEE